MTITQQAIKNKPPDIGLDKQPNTSEYRAWRDRVAELLDEHGYHEQAERWDFCDNSPRYVINRKTETLPASADTVWICSASSDHSAVLFSPSCDFRICPDCAPRQSARLINRYLPTIEKQMALHPEYRLRKITLTRAIQLGDVGFKEAAQAGFDLIQKAMRKVVGKNWNQDSAGLLANWEVGEMGLKLHYHIIYLGNWVDWAKLRDAWHELTGDSYVVFVQAVKQNDADWQGAVIETLKYATKFYKEDQATGKRKYLDPELTVQLFIALQGTRRIRSYGSFYNIDPPPERVFCCADCNAKMVNISVGAYDVWRLGSFSEDAHRRIISNALLPYRTANKSPPENTESDKSDKPQAKMLPVFDQLPIEGISHYDS